MDISVTIEQITAGIVAIAALLTSIAALWKRIDRVKKGFDDKLENAIKQVVLESNQRQDERTAIMLENLKAMFKLETKNIEKRLNDFNKDYQQNQKEEWSVIELLKESLIEAYKNDIRTVYHQLRDTGQISDADKAYVDKIFPKYVAIGGNSDIQAKYEELSRVYERRTQEKFDERFEKTKRKKDSQDIDK